MIRLIFFTLPIIFLFCYSPLFAQNGQYDLRFFVAEIDQFNLKMYVDVEIRAESANTTFNVSDQNYRFSFDTDVLANPVLVQEFVLSGLVETVSPPTLSFYAPPHTLTGTVADIVSYNIELSYGDGYPLNDVDYVKVGRLGFDIQDPLGVANFTWFTTDPFVFPKTFVGETYNGNLYEAMGGSFNNYIQDLSNAFVNYAPTAVNDTADVFSNQVNIINVAENDSDPENLIDAFSVSILSTPPLSEGVVSIDSISGGIVFLPNSQFVGSVTPFEYQICDQGTTVYATQGNLNPDSPSVPTTQDSIIAYKPPVCSSAFLHLEVLAPDVPQYALRVFLEGAYDVGEQMRTELNFFGWVPLVQPYSMTPWNYAGLEMLDTLDANIVDWVLVTARTDLDHSTTVATTVGLLYKDGWIRDLEGGPLTFTEDITVFSGVYIAVYHRNHIGVMTASKQFTMPGYFSYDFTDDPSKSYQGVTGIKELEPGVFGLFSGDYNANGQVQNTDYNSVLPFLGFAGYRFGDFNLNGQVQNTDIQDFGTPNIGRGAGFSY